MTKFSQTGTTGDERAGIDQIIDPTISFEKEQSEQVAEQHSTPTGAKGHVQRLGLSVMPAVGMTLGLFAAMAALIAVDFKPAEAETVRLIGIITPEPIADIKIEGRPKPEPLEAAAQPAPPPRLKIAKVAINVPSIEFPEITPSINPGTVTVLKSPPVAIANGDVLPIRPPVVTYPIKAISLNLEGSCKVVMDVSARGRPFNINADCTDTIFEREAVRAIGRVEFRPKIVEGVAVERTNVVYPLTFALQ